GEFRTDLYYRLEALRLRLPALRDRPEDIPLLIEQFARRLRPDVDPDFLDGLKRNLMARTEWPGNIRELRNAVEKAILLGDLGSAYTPPEGLPTLSARGRFDGSSSFRQAKDQ